ncbi:uncharacterized protein LOC122535525 [Frieseomelitta varia]|uniref:uncharacterized protein LOC122535525 n=1 Tax=Frieseomelitta varia TaxID=561572 RepID=UPI001CB67977|nr:uncharacterized protein LOC122535525 [Frieseomelitta varia]
MHYSLHITVVFVGLWILRGDVNAAKNGLSAEVLTSFARNIASVLSATLLNEYQDPPSNQSSTNLLNRIQEAQFPLDIDHAPPESPANSSNASFNRYPRYTRESSSNEGKQATFQDTLVTNVPQYSKYYNSEAYKPYEFAVNRDSRISYDQLNVETPENVNEGGAKENSIDADVKTAALHYRYHQSPGFGYKPERTHQLPNPNHYPLRLDLQSNYHRLSPQTPVGPPQSSSSAETVNPIDENENAQVARITRRPFHLNYHSPLNAPYYPFHHHAGFHPHDRPVEGESQNPANGQAGESNPSKLIDDQSQGQTAFAGYDYGPRFHYRHPYYDGFYPGFPGFYPRPFNESFRNHGNGNHGDHNGTNGAFGPYGYHHGPFFHGPKFHGPYVPYNSYYPYFHGPRRPENHGPPENHGNSEQLASPENGYADGNSTGNHHGGYPYYGGFPYYGPYHGFNFHPYPLAPFHGLPYRFGHGFHSFLFPGFKPVPYLNFYHHYPFAHWHPFGGYYHHNNRPMMAEKPGQTEKNGNENSEPAPNSEAEMLSESKLEAIRSLALSGYEKRFNPEFVSKERNGDRVFNELS